MEFLADESCDFAVVRALRGANRAVVAVAEIAPRADDDVVLELATRESKILLTEDKDFGQLVYAHQQATSGVILLRFPLAARRGLTATVLRLIEERGPELWGRFVVVKPGRIRIGRQRGV